mmetsp:Transcript_14906/g.40196  ORF Transcript_14906/g.40196 Transcript_14906/m.40196 type:complete len:83 (-) Transcript_14906:1458-1706(-)
MARTCVTAELKLAAVARRGLHALLAVHGLCQIWLWSQAQCTSLPPPPPPPVDHKCASSVALAGQDNFCVQGNNTQAGQALCT